MHNIIIYNALLSICLSVARGVRLTKREYDLNFKKRGGKGKKSTTTPQGKSKKKKRFWAGQPTVVIWKAVLRLFHTAWWDNPDFWSWSLRIIKILGFIWLVRCLKWWAHSNTKLLNSFWRMPAGLTSDFGVGGALAWFLEALYSSQYYKIWKSRWRKWRNRPAPLLTDIPDNASSCRITCT